MNTIQAIKSYMSAALVFVVSAAFADTSAENVISINVWQSAAAKTPGYIDTSVAQPEYPTLAGDVPANAWVCMQGIQNSGYPATQYSTGWDGESGSVTNFASKFTIQANYSGGLNNYSYDENEEGKPEFKPDYMRTWISQKAGASKTITYEVLNIPYAKYKVIVYCAGVGNANNDTARGVHFMPLKINGTTYTYDSSGELKEGTSEDYWGDVSYCTTGVMEGTNAMIVAGLKGNLTIVYTSARAGMAALQIVEEEADEDPYEGLYAKDDVISVNICHNQNAPGHIAGYGDPQPTYAGYIAGAAWADFDAVPQQAFKNGPRSVGTYWNGSEQKAMTCDATIYMDDGNTILNYGWDSNNANAEYAPDYLRMWGAKKSGDAGYFTIDFAEIPFYEYTLVVYMSGAPSTVRNADAPNAFPPVYVNGTAYTAVNGKTASGDTFWGDCMYAYTSKTFAEGQNTLVLSNIVSSSVSISNLVCNAGVAAVQIISQDSAVYIAAESDTSAVAGTLTVNPGEKTQIVVRRLDGSYAQPLTDVDNYDGTHTITFVPTIAGEYAYLNLEFNGNYSNSGTRGGGFDIPPVTNLFPTAESAFASNTTSGVYGLYTAVCPAGDGLGAAKDYSNYDGFTFAVYGVMPWSTNTVFASIGGWVTGILAFTRGAARNEVRLVIMHSAQSNQSETIASFEVPDCRWSKHLYSVSYTGAKTYTVYVDGQPVAGPVVLSGNGTIGPHVRVGSGRGGLPDGCGYFAFDPNDPTTPAAELDERHVKYSYVDALRVYTSALDAAAQARLAEELPFVQGRGDGFIVKLK